MSSRIPKDDYLAHWLVDQLEAGDNQAWETREQEDTLRRVVDAAARLEVPATRTREAAWDLLQARIQAEATPQPTVRIRSFPRLPSLIRVAAALAVLLVAGLLVQRWLAPDDTLPAGLIVQETAAQVEPLDFALPDGSTVTLNDRSRATYDAQGWTQGQRAVALSGEAFFRVVPGSTFTVETAQGMVTVRGTSFNVFTRKEKMEVACFSGEVAVSLKSSPATAEVLTPGQAVRSTTAGNLERYAIEIASDSPGWSQGVFTFRDAPLEQVLEEIERQYEVRLVLEVSGEGRFSGSFFADDPLTTTLAHICAAMGLEAQAAPDGTFHLLPAGRQP